MKEGVQVHVIYPSNPPCPATHAQIERLDRIKRDFEGDLKVLKTSSGEESLRGRVDVILAIKRERAADFRSQMHALGFIVREMAAEEVRKTG